MAKAEKLLERLKTVPKDFTWDEVMKVVSLFGFTEQRTGKTGGARRKYSDGKGNRLNFLHEPHPGKILKRYAVEQLLEYLIEKGHIKNE